MLLSLIWRYSDLVKDNFSVQLTFYRLFCLIKTHLNFSLQGLLDGVEMFQEGLFSHPIFFLHVKRF